MSLSASCKEENLSLQVVKRSILNKERRKRDKSALFELEANVAQTLGRGGSKYRSPENRDTFYARSKSRGRPTCFYCGKFCHFQKNCQHLRKEKGIVDDVEPRKFYDDKNT